MQLAEPCPPRDAHPRLSLPGSRPAACPAAALSPERKAAANLSVGGAGQRRRAPPPPVELRPTPGTARRYRTAPTDLSFDNDNESARPGLRLPAPAPMHTQQFPPRRSLRRERGRGARGGGGEAITRVLSPFLLRGPRKTPLMLRKCPLLRCAELMTM